MGGGFGGRGKFDRMGRISRIGRTAVDGLGRERAEDRLGLNRQYVNIFIGSAGSFQSATKPGRAIDRGDDPSRRSCPSRQGSGLFPDRPPPVVLSISTPRIPCVRIPADQYPPRGCRRDGLLAVQVRAELLLLRRPDGRARPDDGLGRRAELPGAELPPRLGPGRRRGAVLPLERRAAGDRRASPRWSREGHPDPTAFDPAADHYDPKSDPANPTWYQVSIRAVRPIDPPLGLPQLRTVPELAGMELLRKGSRLSIQPVSRGRVGRRPHAGRQRYARIGSDAVAR